MSKEAVFKKYGINQSHETWEPTTDNWMSVEIYREMHDGALPPPDDLDMQYVMDFLDKTADPKYFFSLKNNGSMYLTAKRMLYRYSEYLPRETK